MLTFCFRRLQDSQAWAVRILLSSGTFGLVMATGWGQRDGTGTGEKGAGGDGDGDGGDLGTADWGRTGFGARHGRPDAGLSRGIPRRGRDQDGGGGEDNPPAGVGGRDN